MNIVIDTSALIATLMDEPEGPAIARAAGENVLIAPASVLFEIGNAFSAGFKSRRYPLSEAIAALDLFNTLEIELREVDIAAAVRLSFELKIYAYDAYVLQCAIDAKGSLLTLDRGLRAAATRLNLPLVEVTQ